jgi:hypothetical protein
MAEWITSECRRVPAMVRASLALAGDCAANDRALTFAPIAFLSVAPATFSPNGLEALAGAD